MTAGLALFASRSTTTRRTRLSRHYTYLPPLSPIPPLGGRGDRRAQLGPRGARRSTSATAAASSSRWAPRTPASRCSSRTIDWSSTTTSSWTITYWNRPRRCPTAPRCSGRDSAEARRDADVTLTIDGRDVGSLHLPFVMRIFSTIAMGIGRDHGSPVSKRYVDDFVFEGRIERVDIQLVSQDSARRQGDGRPRGHGPTIDDGTTANARRTIRGTAATSISTPHYAERRRPDRWRGAAHGLPG